MSHATDNTLTIIREELRPLGPPIVVFNKSHSGSRLLARLIGNAGVFMGAHQNESNDSWDILKLVEYLVSRYYPDYSPLWNPNQQVDKTLADLIREVFASHTEGLSRGAVWGWKLCETAYILPVLDFLFPDARYIHLIRDGRDVAFTDHRAPNRPFWKKIYFNTDGIMAWRGLKFHNRDYAERSHIYNAMHWANSVAVGRAYGAMLRERYLEVRYEDLCESFDTAATRILEFIGASNIPATIEKMRRSVYTKSVHKYLRQPKEKVNDVVEIVKPLLLSLGYLKPDGLLDVARARVRPSKTFD
ncbi:MAG TPA: sulfotransferase [Chthoniobacterales bacterium]|nr:sulfotransferase [Chthoniobacterales bacterium]